MSGSYTELYGYEAVRNLCGRQLNRDARYPEIDELALKIAQSLRGQLSSTFPITLSFEQWTRMTALLQVEVRTVIDHLVFDEPPFPGSKP